MLATKLKGTITKNRRLELVVPRSLPPGDVEVIVLRAEPAERPRARRVGAQPHPAAGIWADREDISDTVEFVSRIRRRLETRRDGRH